MYSILKLALERSVHICARTRLPVLAHEDHQIQNYEFLGVGKQRRNVPRRLLVSVLIVLLEREYTWILG